MVYGINIDVKHVNLCTLMSNEQKWNLRRRTFFLRLYEYGDRKNVWTCSSKHMATLLFRRHSCLVLENTNV
jgi:hypothetical protein